MVSLPSNQPLLGQTWSNTGLEYIIEMVAPSPGYIGTQSLLEAIANVARTLRAANPDLTYGAPPPLRGPCAFNMSHGPCATAHTAAVRFSAVDPSSACFDLPPPPHPFAAHQCATQCSATRAAAT